MATIPGALTSLQKRREIMVVTVASSADRSTPTGSHRVHLERIAQPGERPGESALNGMPGPSN
jgi:hypothetical protein